MNDHGMPVRCVLISAVLVVWAPPTTGPRALPTSTREYHVTVSGHFDCLDNGVARPLANAHVEIMDSDNDAGTFGDDLMGMTDTDPDGNFSSDGTGGDGGSWSWSKPDVYVRVLLDDQWSIPIRVKDDVGSTESFATPQHDHDNVEGDVSIGSWWWGSRANTDEHNATAPCIWLTSRDAAVRFVNQMHEPLPEGKYEIQYWAGVYATPGITPFTTLATTYWPRHYSMRSGRTNQHEFYHAIRHGYDGDQSHWDWDDTRFRYGRSHNYCDSKHIGETHANREGFAFNEGWAQFAGYRWFGGLWRCDPSVPVDMTLEGDVAVLLGQLEDAITATLNARGSAQQARQVMLSVLRDNPGSIHSYDEFCRAVNNSLPGACGPGMHPVTVHPAQVATELSSALQMRMLQAEIAAQSDTAQSLMAALRAARTVAAKMRVVCRGEDCEGVFKALIRPAMLEREVRVHQLVVRRLAALSADTARRATSLHEFEQRFVAGTKEFEQKVQRLNLTSLDQAMKSARPLAKNSPAAAPLLEELRHKIALRRGTVIPSSDLPRFLVMQDLSGANLDLRQGPSNHR